MKKVWLYLLMLTVVMVRASAQTTTLTAETSSNILSASPAFPGFADYRTTDPTATPNITPGFPIITDVFDPPPSNISKVNVHNLLYSGFSGKVLVETQTWFCSTVTQQFQRDYSTQNMHQFNQCNEHLVVGYDSDDVTHANLAIDEMFSRGFDGFIADVSGGQNNCRTGTTASGTPLSFTFTTGCPAKVLRVDNAVQAMMNRINSSYPNQLQFMLMEDQSAFDGDNNCSRAATGIDQPLCIAQKIESDIQYFNSTYFFTNPNTYINNAGAPIVAFFIADKHQGTDSTGAPINPLDLSQCDGGPTACNFENGTTCGGLDANNAQFSQCWTAIWDAVRAHSPVPITMIFRNQGGFTHEQSDGSFQWVDPNQATGTAINESTQEDFTNGTEVDNFYAAAKTSGKIVFGLVKKGFDREDAPFNDNPLGAGKVADQQCSQVWSRMFDKINSNFSTANQIPFVIVGTWDDYEEGTEIETGISDCHRVDVSGETGLVRWNLEPDGYPLTLGLPYPPATTVHHYAVYSSTDGQNLSLIEDNISCPSGANCSLDVLPLAANMPNGTYTFYVKAVGQPSITNHIGQATQVLKDFAVHFTDSNSTSSPFDVFVSSRPGNSDSFNLTGSSNIPGFSINTPTVTVGVIANVTANIPPGEGTWHIGITATDTRTGGTDSINFDLTVLGDPSFAVPVSPSSATVTAGSSTSFTASESSTSGFTAPVSLSASGLPAGATASFNPTTISGGSGSSQATIATSDSTPAGTYAITISASDGGYTQNQTFTLTVDPPPPPPPPGGGGCDTQICPNQ